MVGGANSYPEGSPQRVAVPARRVLPRAAHFQRKPEIKPAEESSQLFCKILRNFFCNKSCNPTVKIPYTYVYCTGGFRRPHISGPGVPCGSGSRLVDRRKEEARNKIPIEKIGAEFKRREGSCPEIKRRRALEEDVNRPSKERDLKLFQCAANYSEGRRLDVVERIAAAALGASGATLIDAGADPDHNRCVLTTLGGEEGIEQAAVAMAREAVRRIDLATHVGAHPRTGAVDVIPIVPLQDAAREDAVELARRIGRRLADEAGLPVVFYEWASPGKVRTLPEIRRSLGAPNTAQSAGAPFQPDLGPSTIDPSAGVAIVGARGPLVAYNVELATANIDTALRIAARIRSARRTEPQLTGVRALGIYLASRGRAQVSMNLTRPDMSPLPFVFDFVRSAAIEERTEAIESEIIGAIPLAALAGASPESILWLRCRREQILETWTEARAPAAREPEESA